jgi:hypothetical protein
MPGVNMVIEAILVALLAAHLLAVNLAMAGPLVAVWIEWWGTRSAQSLATQTAHAVARISLTAALLGMALGVLLLGIRWQLDDRAYFSAVAIIPRSRLWFALAELVFYVACMTAYLGLWNRWAAHRVWHRLLAAAAALNLLMHFPALFTIVSVASTRPLLWGEVLDRAGYWRLLLDGEVASRVVHVWLAALVVAGIALMSLALRTAAGHAAASGIVQRGAWLALAAALLQIPIGLWATIELPDASQQQLLGHNWLATALFLSSLLLALHLMHTLATLALGDGERKLVHRSAAVVCTLMLAMTGTRTCLQRQAVPQLPAVADACPAANCLP